MTRVFPDLSDSVIPPIQSTIGSPLQYNYRTKITPHFQAPPKKAKPEATSEGQKPDWLDIGFNYAGRNKVLDIEVSHIHCLSRCLELIALQECPIATSVINNAYTPLRENIIKWVAFTCLQRIAYGNPLETSTPTRRASHCCFVIHLTQQFLYPSRIQQHRRSLRQLLIHMSVSQIPRAQYERRSAIGSSNTTPAPSSRTTTLSYLY